MRTRAGTSVAADDVGRADDGIGLGQVGEHHRRRRLVKSPDPGVDPCRTVGIEHDPGHFEATYFPDQLAALDDDLESCIGQHRPIQLGLGPWRGEHLGGRGRRDGDASAR